MAGLDLDQEGWLELFDRSFPAVQDVQFAAFDIDLDEIQPGDARPGDQGIHRVDRHGYLLMAHELDVRPESSGLAREEGPAGNRHPAAERDTHDARACFGVKGDSVLTEVLQATDSEDPPPYGVRELQRLDAVDVPRRADKPG